ncbi:MAG: polyprenyl synthetase family protein [Deltaproteobacteria bacterium]|nr:polyprenyl synthetase family protein [Deltaproteobacteria bacterium]
MTRMHSELESTWQPWRERVNARLEALLDEIGARPGCPSDLLQAMRHALLGGGKRLRPLLVLAAAGACGGGVDEALDAACCVEMVHAYSLIHDDLPAMDDDDFRRGAPACHRAFGEALAILAGDALLTHAFERLARAVPPPLAAEAVEILGVAAGASGMVGGQADDVRSDGAGFDARQIESIHRRKTACLMRASLELGALVAGGTPSQRAALACYGEELGRAFQIADDLLAHAGDEDALGRPAGSDRDQGRHTHPALLGPADSLRRALELLDRALDAISDLGPEAGPLRALVELVRERAVRARP